MENLISKDDNNLFNEINKYREDPSSFSKAFNLTSKFLGRFKNQRKNSTELAKCANDLNEFISLDKFDLSEGLSKSANKIFEIVKGYHDKLSSFKKMSDTELNEIILEFVEVCELPFLIVDFGSQEQLLPRLMISELDPERHNSKQIRDPQKKAIGVCSKAIDDDDTFCSVIIISHFVKEKSFKVDNRIDVDEVIINESKEESQIVNEEIPIGTEENSVVDKENLVVNEEKPVVYEKKPIESEEKPVVNEEIPIESEEKPVVNEEKLIVNEEKPVVNEEKPLVNEKNEEKKETKDDSDDEFEIKGSNNKNQTIIDKNNAPNSKDPVLRSKVKATKQDLNTSKKPIEEEVPTEVESKIIHKVENQNNTKDIKSEPVEKKDEEKVVTKSNDLPTNSSSKPVIPKIIPPPKITPQNIKSSSENKISEPIKPALEKKIDEPIIITETKQEEITKTREVRPTIKLLDEQECSICSFSTVAFLIGAIIVAFNLKKY